MAITSISRDWGQDPSIVRITTTDDLTDITTTGYLLAQADNIEALNNGEFEWLADDMVLISYDGGEGFFTRNPSSNAFVAETDPGSLSETLQNGDIFVGNALNIATGVTPSGDITLSNAGVFSIAAGAVELAMLDAGIAPSHVVKFAGQHTTAGGAAAEAITVTGALATDLAFVQLVDPGTNTVSVVQAVVTADTLTVTFDGDPGADAIINYQLLRAAA